MWSALRTKDCCFAHEVATEAACFDVSLLVRRSKISERHEGGKLGKHTTPAEYLAVSATGLLAELQLLILIIGVSSIQSACMQHRTFKQDFKRPRCNILSHLKVGGR